MKRFLIYLVIHVILWTIINFFLTPNGDLIIIQTMFLVTLIVTTIIKVAKMKKNKEDINYHYEYLGSDFEDFVAWLLLPAAIVGVILGGSALINGPMIRSGSYMNQIKPEEKEFTQVLDEFDVNTVQVLDANAAKSLGDRTFGEIGADKISQFAVSDIYTQQVYKGKLVRVTPAEYSGLGAALNGAGTPGYIIVDVVTGEANFVKTEKPMQYVLTGAFSYKLNRYVRGKNLFERFYSNRWRFEIDNNGNPYYITTIYGYQGILNAPMPKGILMVDPITGTINKYSLDDVPTWVDIVYTAQDILKEYRNYGKYQNGWWNSIFAKKGVLSTTDDYSYLKKDNQLYLYTGITSVSNDESNVGFIYTNLRTQETSYISCVGAEEYSAKSAAEGAVQEKGYTAVFPTLVRVNNAPTYFLSLKDKTGLIKAYAFVDVVDYTKVKVSEAEQGVENALNNYKKLLDGKNIDSTNKETTKKEIVIKNIVGYSVEGNTVFYIEDTENNRYIADISISNNLPFIHSNDKIVIECTTKDVAVITKIY